MKWKTWLKGLAAAAIGGSATVATQIATSQQTPNFEQIGIGAGIGGLVTALAYLMKSPLPAEFTPVVPPVIPPPKDQAPAK